MMTQDEQPIQNQLEKLKSWIGDNPTFHEHRSWFYELQRVSFYEASQIQCIGMHTPVRIEEVYQPTRLQVGDGSSITKAMTVGDFLLDSNSAVIKAGPGYGKTTFLQHVFVTQAALPDVLPVLISLRKPNAVLDLGKFVGLLSSIDGKKWNRKKRFLLLVDGYDEVDSQKQKAVSETLMTFESIALGSFYLTCRKFYDVFYLKTRVVNVAPFTEQDQLEFTSAFLRLYGVSLDAEKMVKELRSRRMEEFLAHPLLLALVCIVKTNPSNPITNSILDLASTAVETLSFRWDMEKGVARQSVTQLSGKNRIDLLSRIAYKIRERYEPSHSVYFLAEEYLEKLQWKSVDPIQVLDETARFYGIFVPYETGWIFVHKVLHDFLAARYWVSSGAFKPNAVSNWDTRAAYAACLLPEATTAMKHALKQLKFPAFAEMLMNSPPFEPRAVAEFFVEAWRKRARSDTNKADQGPPVREIDLDYFGYASLKFLNELVWVAVETYSMVDEPVVCFAILEVASRKERLSESAFQICLAHFDRFHRFEGLHRGQWRTASLSEVVPQILTD
jgi:hypothetical protein